jgi:hypothetical protein
VVALLVLRSRWERKNKGAEAGLQGKAKVK